MSLRVLTYSGALELGQSPPGAPKCGRCDRRANVEVDVVTGLDSERVIPIARRRIRNTTEGAQMKRGALGVRRVALCSGCVAKLVSADVATGKYG